MQRRLMIHRRQGLELLALLGLTGLHLQRLFDHPIGEGVEVGR
jgi:hypothetical protein